MPLIPAFLQSEKFHVFDPSLLVNERDPFCPRKKRSCARCAFAILHVHPVLEPHLETSSLEEKRAKNPPFIPWSGSKSSQKMPFHLDWLWGPVDHEHVGAPK